MKFLRTGAALAAAALAATSTGIYAYAQEDADMQTELKYVKQRVAIPESYTTFDYSTDTDCGKTKYIFTWTDPKSEMGDSVSVSITGKVIKEVTVYKFNGGGWKPSLAKLSNEQILEAAKQHAKNINPTVSDRLEFRDTTLKVSLYGEEATVKFRRKSDGTLVRGQTGSITVNKNTGELIKYSVKWINGAGFSSKTGAISKSKAKTAFKKLFPVELVYVLSYDAEKDKYTPHLIYRQTKNGYINAFTGKLSAFDSYGYYEEDDTENRVMMSMAYPGTYSSAGQVTITAEELEKIKSENSFVGAEAVFEELKKTGVLYIPDTSVITGESISYDESGKYYVKNVTFTANRSPYDDLSGDGSNIPISGSGTQSTAEPIEGSFTVNAKTGELLSFKCDALDTGEDLAKSTADAKAEAVTKALLTSSKYSQFSSPKSVKNKNAYDGYDPQTALPIDDGHSVSRTYTAYRTVNGIQCADDNVRFVISNTGAVSSYTLTYHSGITYPDPSKKISESKAYSKFFEQANFGRIYRCAYDTVKDRVVTALVYTSTDTLYIDAFTGKLTQADGTEIAPAEETAGYTDLEGSKYKEYAEELALYDITLMDSKGRLDPSGTITYSDFNKLLGMVGMFFEVKDTDGIKDSTKLSRKLAAKVAAGARFGREACELRSAFSLIVREDWLTSDN